MAATKDKNGSWTARFYFTNYHGERKQKYTRGFKTKKEALEYEREFLAKAEFSVSMSFKSLVELYMEDLEPRVKISTLALRQSIISKTILPFFENFKVNEISPVVIRRYQTHLMTYKTEKGKGYSQTYLKTLSITLSTIFNFAVKFHKLQDNPCTKAGTIGKATSGEMSIWTFEEFKIFSECCKENIEAYTVFNILFFSGMRVGESLALNYGDVDLTNKTIRVNKTLSNTKGIESISSPKTEGSNRTIPITNQLCSIIQEYSEKFYGITDKTRLFNYTPSWLRKLMKKFSDVAELKQIRIHDLRHSHASFLIHLGVNPLLISKRLGHEKVDTTLNIYAHLYPDSSEKMIAMIEEMW